MQPLGRSKVKFPNKTKEWAGKGVAMWWESGHECNKPAEKRKYQKEIEAELLAFEQ